MPKSFLVRKKLSPQSVRAWNMSNKEPEETERIDGAAENVDVEKVVLVQVKDTKMVEDDIQSKDIKVAPVKENPIKEVFKSPLGCHSQQENFRLSEIHTREFPNFVPFQHPAPFMPSLRPLPLNSFPYAPLPPFLHIPTPVYHRHPMMFQPSPFPSQLRIGVHPCGNNESVDSVNVLSPAEIPSPSLTPLSTISGDSSPGVVFFPTPRHSDQSRPLQSPGCHSIGGSVLQAPRVNIEVINNGFGIKNPIFSDDKSRSLATEVPMPHSTSIGSMATSESRHLCKLCGFKTDTVRLLQQHLKKHKEVKRFLCTVCGKGFNDTFDLKRHTRTHTGVRPYKCSTCNKAFTQRCSLESHCKKIHGTKIRFAFNERRVKVYVCEDCGHSTADPEEHFLHLRSQHPNNPALLRCHDRRQFKFGRRKDGCFEQEFHAQRVS